MMAKVPCKKSRKQIAAAAMEMRLVFIQSRSDGFAVARENFSIKNGRIDQDFDSINLIQAKRR